MVPMRPTAPVWAPSAGDTVREFHTCLKFQLPVTRLKYCSTKNVVTITTQWRGWNQICSGGCESGRASMCESREREREMRRGGKHEMLLISRFCGRSAVNLGLVLASRQAWQEGSFPECTAVSPSLSCLMLPWRSFSRRFLLNVDVVSLLEDNKQQLWVQITAVRWKPCVVFHISVKDYRLLCRWRPLSSPPPGSLD